MADIRPTAAALIGGKPYVLLTLRVGSRVVRLTDRDPVTISSRVQGAADLRFNSGLTPVNVDRVIGWFAGGLTPRSVACQVVLNFDIAAAVAAGDSLYTATAEIAQWWPGQSWEDRRVLVEGRITEPMYGEQGEVFAFSVTDDPGDDQGLIPAPSQRLSDATFPRASATRSPAYSGANPRSDPQVEGASGSLIIGEPGNGIPLRVAGSVWSTLVPASPMLYVERTDSGTQVTDHVYLVAWHPVDATQVRTWNFTDDVYDTVPVELGTDESGQTFSYVNPGASGGIPSGDSAELYCSFTGDDGGGLPNPYGNGPLRRADHVIRWALSQSTLRVDQSQFARLGALRSYQIDGYINVPVSPWQWLRDEILPLLPVSPVVGPDGVYLAVWNMNATPVDAVGHIEVGINAERVAPISMSPVSEVANKLSIRFAPNAKTGNMALQRVLTGRPTPGEPSSDQVLRSYWCQRSQDVFGTREVNIETAYLYDAATAEQVLAWKARAMTFPRRQTAYALPGSMDWLRPGDILTLTDASMSLSQQTVHVEAIEPQAGGITVGVTWWEPFIYPQAG